MHTAFTDNYRELEDRVCSLSKEEVKAQWEALGSPKLVDYGLAVYSGISGDGWVCIDNSNSDHNKKHPLQMFCDRTDYLVSRNSNDQEKSTVFHHWEQRACLLAHSLNIPRLEVNNI